MNQALLAIVIAYFLVVYIGRHIPHPRLRNYAVIGFLTIMQVAIVLYFMFTMEAPPTK